ncbi:spore germination protein GerW family protein [Cellulomonas sp. S1-8]|uniref:spore germination protein GerW family protein n=1 Tax=Cellulomonas sp. S1-8 TaxID=2904790 RepID=UPI002243A8F4|nr:spore germination protein GerW family protein [Cellulomonas sp. S1-8]UZN04962.1 spore germination protein GerW family protein [Cellulomonas sp. S1-8]
MTERSFDPAGLTRVAQDTFTVRRVFGEAYERDGQLVVPVARVTGLTGAGAGSGGGDVTPGADHGTEQREGGPGGRAAHGTGDGGGGGFAAHVTPVGVFVVDDDGAHWRPAVDVNRVVLGWQVVATLVGCVGALAWAVRRR